MDTPDATRLAEATCLLLRAERLRPSDDALAHLAAGYFSGGERWSEWAPVFAALPPETRPGASMSVTRAWGRRGASVAALQRAFDYRAMAACVARLRAAGVDPLPPPATAARVDDWEARHGIALPADLRRYLLEVSAGPPRNEETWIFHLPAVEGASGEPAPLTALQGGCPAHLDTLARVLHCVEGDRQH